MVLYQCSILPFLPVLIELQENKDFKEKRTCGIWLSMYSCIATFPLATFKGRSLFHSYKVQCSKKCCITRQLQSTDIIVTHIQSIMLLALHYLTFSSQNMSYQKRYFLTINLLIADFPHIWRVKYQLNNTNGNSGFKNMMYIESIKLKETVWRNPYQFW